MPTKLPHLCSTLAVAALIGTNPRPAQAQTKPNIIFILADDLGYGDIGVFFQNTLRAKGDRSKPWHDTPNLDAMAAQGIELPQHYCSSPVCAPSRASFLLGVDQGHANVRDNQFDKALENNYTIAGVLKSAGYSTACIGKWGLQGKPSPDAPHGWPAHPQNRGFDSYFGYISHGAGHFHYPKEDSQKLIDGAQNVVNDYDGCYTTDLFTARAKKWVNDQHTAHPNQPFFLYLAYDTPHATLQYPPKPYPAGRGLKGGLQWLGTPHHEINTADGTPDSYCHPDYANATWDADHNPATPEVPWPDVYKRYATDVRRIDDCVGDLLQELKDLKIDDNTLVVFTSDNGPSQESYLPERNEANFFHSFGPFDGIKRDVWEGGIRVGAITRWPGHIAPGRVSQHPSAFWDWLPTFTEAAGLPAPSRSDGVSLLPTLQGTGVQKDSRLYFEYFVEGKTPSYPEFVPAHRGRPRQQMQVLRLGDYIGIRTNITSHADLFEIFNIIKDPEETHNLAKDPAFAPLQQRMHNLVLTLRRPDTSAPRPYDNELVPALNPGKTMSGVHWEAFQNRAPWLAQVAGLKSLALGTVARPSWPQGNQKLAAGANEILFSGFIEVPKDGDYTFSLATSSKALFRLHEATVIDADFGYHRDTPISGTIKLKAGQHPFSLYVLKSASTTPSLKLQWSFAGPALQDIPNSVFSFSNSTSLSQIPFVVDNTPSKVAASTTAAAPQVAADETPNNQQTGTPPPTVPKETRRVIYKTTTNATGQTVKLHMNVFDPPGHKASDKTPVIVLFFGGGWNSGWATSLSRHCAYFASRGIVAIAPDYRVKNRQGTTPFESVADAKSALRYIRAHANELGIDPNRIVAGGTSAGGHLAACTAIILGLDEKGEDTTVSSVPNALVLYNPVIDTSPAGYGNARLKERWQDISPLQHVRPGLPPTIVFHGDADQTVPYANVVAFNEAMKKAGNRCELVTLHGVGHGFVPPFDTLPAQLAIRETDKFLESLGYLQGEPTLPSPTTTN